MRLELAIIGGMLGFIVGAAIADEAKRSIEAWGAAGYVAGALAVSLVGRIDPIAVPVTIAAVGFFVGACLAAVKNRNEIIWAIAGVLFTFPALLVLLLVRPVPEGRS